jgi:hypothetical protein
VGSKRQGRKERAVQRYLHAAFNHVAVRTAYYVTR